MYFLITVNRAMSFLSPFLINLSTSALNLTNCSAMIAFKIVIGAEEFAEEPTALNSNLLPVKAKGEVRLRSVLSNKICGILGMPNQSALSSFIFFADA